MSFSSFRCVLRRMCGLTVPVAAAALMVLPAATTAAVPDNDKLGGRLTARVEGKTVTFPTLKTDIKADVKGDLATITVTQIFANPAKVPLNATYLFPLNKNAAVFAMKMEVADEIVTAVIKKKAEARKTFENAKRQGKSAALLEQHRPNMFTQELANLMPGLPVKVTLQYSQTLPRVDGNYELVVPLVVGPRYRPAHHRVATQIAQVGKRDAPANSRDDHPATPQPSIPAAPRFGIWELGPVPKYPEVAGLTIPPAIDADRVSVSVDLRSAVAIKTVRSDTHAVEINGSENRRTIRLTKGKTIDNRDFVLRYQIADTTVAAGLLAHRDKRGGYFSLMIEPPAVPTAEQTNAREVVFILDTSGSMSGRPIEASKTFMRHALRGLRPADSFRIIQFSNNADEFASRPVLATPANVAAGLAYVESLRASGGTEMMSGLLKAYRAAGERNTLRLIVFLSDGYVSNEPDILREVATNVSAGRMYTFGIGTAVNRYLIAEMARLGRGRHRVIDPTRQANEAAIEFANSISTPVLTDIEIDWGSLDSTEISPNRIPDLFAGSSLRIQGRYKKGGTHVIKVKGRVNGREATMPIKVELPKVGSAADALAIPLIWARSRVADYTRELMVPHRLRTTSLTNDNLKGRIIKLGLDYAIVTQWTSFVAVAMRVVNPSPESATDAGVPLPMVDGVRPEAYGKRSGERAGGQSPAGTAKGIRASLKPLAPKSSGPKLAFNGPANATFGGGATPEPEHIFGLGLIVLMLLARFRALFRKTREV